MSSVRSHDSARQRVAPADIVLVNWPLRDQPIASLAAAAAFVAIAWGVGHLAEQPWVGSAAGVALFASTWRWWVPVTFGFGPAGVTQSIFGRSFRKPWAAVVRYERLARGVLLLPDAEGAPASSLRGRYVAWLNRRDELVTLLEFYVGARSQDSRWLRSSAARPQPPRP